MSPADAIEIPPDGPHRFTVFWLHGLGADGSDLLPLVEALALPPGLGVRLLFPHAPVIPVTINGGLPMRAWYDIASPDLGRAVDTDGIRRSAGALLERVALEAASGIPAGRVILAGFSQGGVVALTAALAAASRPLGALGLSCYLPLHEPGGPGRLQVFMGHGRMDEVVPYGLGVAARDWLRRQGHQVEWHGYPVGHTVCAAEVAHIRAWLLGRLTPPMARPGSPRGG